MSQYKNNDRRDYSMLEKYLDSNFSNLTEKITDLKQQDKEHYDELKNQITSIHNEMQVHYKEYSEHVKEEYPHKKCQENSEKIEKIQSTLDGYLKSISNKEIYNKGLKKGVYLSATTLKYIFWSGVGAIISLITFWEKIRGFFNHV